MKRHSIFSKIIAAAALCLLLALPCGCGEKDSTADVPAVSCPDVSASDVSGSDVSSSDVSSADTGLFGSEDADAAGPVAAVMLNAEAFNARDIEAYMATIDPEGDACASTREDAEYIFAHYRLSISILDAEITSLKDDTAVVTVTQITAPAAEVSASDVSASDVSGSDAPLVGKDLTDSFVPCRTVLAHSMKRIGDAWYITSTVTESYTDLTAE